MMRLPKDWEYVTLENLCKNEKNAIKRGPFGSTITKDDFVLSGYKVYEQKNVIQDNFSTGRYYISEDKFKALRDFELITGDIVISCSGTIGRIAIVPPGIQKGIINQALLKITLDENRVIPRYFVYLFKSAGFQSQIIKTSHGSAIHNLSSLRELKRINVPVPPLDTQRKIVTILDKAEETKELSARANELTQNLLQSVFLEMFGDPIKNPKGWNKKFINDLSVLVTDGDHNPPKRVENGIPHLSARNITGSLICVDGCNFISPDDFEKVKKRYLPLQGDVLVTCTGTLGRTAIVPNDFTFSCDRDIAAIRVDRTQILPEYLISYLNTQNIQRLIEVESRSSAIPHLYLKEIRRIPVLVPPLDRQALFIKRVHMFNHLVCQQQSAEVAVDQLIHNMTLKAFTGELVV